MIMNEDKYKDGIKKLISDNNLNHLTYKQLQCVFHILAHAPKINYRCCAPEFEGKPNIMGYVGAGWFVEDRNQ